MYIIYQPRLIIGSVTKYLTVDTMFALMLFYVCRNIRHDRIVPYFKEYFVKVMTYYDINKARYRMYCLNIYFPQNN